MWGQVRVTALALAGMLCGTQVQARDIVIGVEDLDYYPVYAVQNGQYVGAAREILDAFAAASGHTISYRPFPIKRLYAEFLGGSVDAKFPDSPKWANAQKTGLTIAYSKPVITYVDGVMVQPRNKGRDIAQFRQLGIVSGFTPFAWLDALKGGSVTLRENPRSELLLKQVLLDRLDGGYVSVAAANYTLDHTMGQPGALIFDPNLPHTRDSYTLSSVSHPELIAEFDTWLAANAGTVRQIINRLGAEKGVQ